MNPINNNSYVGRSGDLGPGFDVELERFKIRQKVFGFTDFKSSLFMSGVDGNVVLQNIENNIEGGSNGDGIEGNLLNWDRYLESNDKKNDILFQAEGDNIFTNVNFNANHYEVMDEKGFTEKIGMKWENGKPYDAFEITQNRISFYDFRFSGTDDGNQENTVFDLSVFENSRWGLQNYTIREVDTSYWSKASDPKNKEYLLSKDTQRIIKESMPQWMTDEIKTQLSEYKEGSVDYWNKFYALAIKLMDQEGLYNGQFK